MIRQGPAGLCYERGRPVKKPLLFLVVIVFVLALVAFSMLYSVRFNERAVVTTFGSAGENAVQTEPGLKFKLPYPVQSVTKYDITTRIAATQGEQQSTLDDAQIIVEAYALWRVTDPLEFYRRFSNAGPRASDHFRSAESTVRSSLRSAISETSRFRLDELYTNDPEGSKFPDLEQAILSVVQSNLTTDSASGYGLEVIHVGISGSSLTNDNSEDVVARMKADRERVAAETLSRGESQASTIQSRAENDARRIRDFASYLASEVRARGESEAGEIIATMSEDPELAVFLAELELLQSLAGRKTTLVLDGTTPGVSLLNPNAFDGVAGDSYPMGSFAARLFGEQPEDSGEAVPASLDLRNAQEDASR